MRYQQTANFASGGGTATPSSETITAQQTINIAHGLDHDPIVWFVYSDGIQENLSVTQVGGTNFTYDFGEAVTGTLYYM